MPALDGKSADCRRFLCAAPALCYPDRMSAPLETRLLRADDPRDFDDAVRLLRAGRLVAVPTETVYGLAADAGDPVAVGRIFEAKQRPANHPLIVHVADAGRIDAWAREIPDNARRLAEAFWPGPLTLLLHKAAQVSPAVTGGRDTVGLRVPDHPVLLKVLQALGGGLAAPSANPYKRLSPTTAGQVLDGLGGRIDAVLDGGPCAVGLESTIVDLTGTTPRILRAGPITRSQLQTALGGPVEFPERHDAAVPGNVAVHYQPRTPLYLIETEDLRQRLRTRSDATSIVVLHHSDMPTGQSHGIVRDLRMPADKAEYAQRLYDTLHIADAAGAAAIWMESPPASEDWRDVQDRLSRAASIDPGEWA
jgi:L-threonylcarbamoyladenylate synthase